MLITDKNELKKYTTEHRIWQGIPSIEVTKGGRIFSTFYSGGIPTWRNSVMEELVPDVLVKNSQF